MDEKKSALEEARELLGKQEQEDREKFLAAINAVCNQFRFNLIPFPVIAPDGRITADFRIERPVEGN